MLGVVALLSVVEWVEMFWTFRLGVVGRFCAFGVFFRRITCVSPLSCFEAFPTFLIFLCV